MEPAFWLERWARGETGFHLPAVNPYLPRHWPALELRPGARVLVPLAGKSVDLLWLREQGHDVVAIELSPLAADAVFAALGAAPRITREAGFECRRVPGLCFLVGDFFAATPALVGRVDAVYDRAALVALPPPAREAYARHLCALQSPAARTLLVGFEYPQQQMQGPPFAVDEAEVRALFGATHEIHTLAREDILAQEPRFQARGVTALAERIYALRRRRENDADLSGIMG
jgi:thiopurine S-methyltransferase